MARGFCLCGQVLSTRVVRGVLLYEDDLGSSQLCQASVTVRHWKDVKVKIGRQRSGDEDLKHNCFKTVSLFVAVWKICRVRIQLDH